MAPFEIYNATNRWRGSDDMRPWLIIDQRGNETFGCFPISSQDYDGTAFLIEASHADFAATGLAKSCYIHDRHLIELHITQFGRKRGVLAGQLLAQFREFSGV